MTSNVTEPSIAPTRRGRRSLAMIASIAMVISIFGAFVVRAEPASAFCLSSSSSGSTGLYASFGREISQWASTCDGDNLYYGNVADTLTDGTCVYISYFKSYWRNTQASCNTTGTNYSYTDNNSYTVFKICKSSGAGCTSQYANKGF